MVAKNYEFFIDGIGESIASIYREHGLNDAMQSMFNSIKNVIPVLSLSCSNKPLMALWTIKLVEYRHDGFVPPEIYSFDCFMSSEELRSAMAAHLNRPVCFSREGNELFFELFAQESQSGMSIRIMPEESSDFYINIFAKKGQTFNSGHADFIERLTTNLAKELQKGFFLPASLAPGQYGKSKQTALDLIRLCPCLKALHKQIQQIAGSDMLALITGETGSGKDVAAMAIHEKSLRRDGPFIKVNCGAIPESLLDSELFGYEKGAFTGAQNSRPGYFEQADGGTIFLDEVGELSLGAQVRLLHVLENGQIQRVGAKCHTKVNIRVIAATNKDLWEESRKGRFREDLCYRLFVCHLEVPPLRERANDLPLLIWYFLNKKSKMLNLPSKLHISKEEIQKLHEYAWPGNVRELEHTLERSLLYSQESSELNITRCTYSNGTGQALPASPPPREGLAWKSLDEHIGEYIQKALIHTNGKVKGKDGAATLLNMDPGTLRYKIKKYGLTRFTRFGR